MKMKFDYLLIGNGMDGTIYKGDYPSKNLKVLRVQLFKSENKSFCNDTYAFEILKVRHHGKTYALGIARPIRHHEMITLLEASPIKPLPEK